MVQLMAVSQISLDQSHVQSEAPDARYLYYVINWSESLEWLHFKFSHLGGGNSPEPGSLDLLCEFCLPPTSCYSSVAKSRPAWLGRSVSLVQVKARCSLKGIKKTLKGGQIWHCMACCGVGFGS